MLQPTKNALLSRHINPKLKRGVDLWVWSLTANGSTTTKNTETRRVVRSSAPNLPGAIRSPPMVHQASRRNRAVIICSSPRPARGRTAHRSFAALKVWKT